MRTAIRRAREAAYLRAAFHPEARAQPKTSLYRGKNFDDRQIQMEALYADIRTYLRRTRPVQ